MRVRPAGMYALQESMERRFSVRTWPELLGYLRKEYTSWGPTEENVSIRPHGFVEPRTHWPLHGIYIGEQEVMFSDGPLLQGTSTPPPHSWKVSLLSAGSIELQILSMEEPLETVVLEVTKRIGTDVNGLVCAYVRIFGDPERAPEALRGRFEPNRRDWQPGSNLRIPAV